MLSIVLMSVDKITRLVFCVLEDQTEDMGKIQARWNGHGKVEEKWERGKRWGKGRRDTGRAERICGKGRGDAGNAEQVKQTQAG